MTTAESINKHLDAARELLNSAATHLNDAAGIATLAGGKHLADKYNDCTIECANIIKACILLRASEGKRKST